MELYKCAKCGEKNIAHHEIEIECTFHETREEPAEYEWYCPYCNSTELDEQEYYEEDEDDATS